MALLDLIQDVCYELGLPAPSSVVNSTEETIKQLLQLTNREGSVLRSKYPWPQLTKEYLFTLVNGQENYILPQDIDSIVYRTMWDRDYHWEIIGPLTPQEWQWRKSGVSALTPRMQYRVKGVTDNQFFITPAPDASSAGHIAVLEYQSTNWISPKRWADLTVFLPNSYSSWNGNFYFTTLGGTTSITPPTHTSGTVSDGGVAWTFTDAPYEKFLTDTDFPLLKQDMVNMGVQWRFMRQKGFDYEELRVDYEAYVVREMTSLKSARTLSLATRSYPQFIGPWSVPDTGFGS